MAVVSVTFGLLKRGLLVVWLDDACCPAASYAKVRGVHGRPFGDEIVSIIRVKPTFRYFLFFSNRKEVKKSFAAADFKHFGLSELKSNT